MFSYSKEIPLAALQKKPKTPHHSVASLWNDIRAPL